jgi:hypothetical protein
MKMLPLFLLVILVGCASNNDPTTGAGETKYASYSTAQLQTKRLQIYDSLVNVPRLSGLPTLYREEYLTENRREMYEIENELHRRELNGDAAAKLKPFSASTNVVEKSR